jgi:hypothetical protein
MKLLRDAYILAGLIGASPVKDLILVSGSDASHARSLGNWLASVATHEPDTAVIVYDLGMDPASIESLHAIHPKAILRRFPYERYPDYFDIRIHAGQYAWKPAIVHEVSREFGRPVCWMDAGNRVRKPLTRLRRVLGKYGFYSPLSKGVVRDWTHPSTLKALEFPERMWTRRNLNGACVAFDPSREAAGKLLEDWYQAALRKEVIAPPGSDRSNHRQDQAVLTVLFYKSPLSDRFLFRYLEGFKYYDFRTHQDAD